MLINNHRSNAEELSVASSLPETTCVFFVSSTFLSIPKADNPQLALRGMAPKSLGQVAAMLVAISMNLMDGQIPKASR